MWEESWLWHSISEIILQWFVSFIKNTTGYSSIEIGDRSLHVAIIDMQVKVTWQIFLCFIVDFKELTRFICEFLTHVGDICKFFEIICCKTHVSPHFTLIHTFCEHMTSISENVLIELDCYKFISAYKLSKIR